MVAHVNRCFPQKAQSMKEAEVRETIRYGTNQAAQYAITAQRDVCKYIDLMFVFGRDFDRDPAEPWASAALHDWSYREPTVRAEALFDEGKKHEKEARRSG